MTLPEPDRRRKRRDRQSLAPRRPTFPCPFATSSSFSSAASAHAGRGVPSRPTPPRASFRPEPHGGDAHLRSRTVAAIVLISSAGLTTLQRSVLPNQVATRGRRPNRVQLPERRADQRRQRAARHPPAAGLPDRPEPFRRFETAAATCSPSSRPMSATTPANAVILTDRAPSSPRSRGLSTPAAPTASVSEDVGALLAAGDAKARATMFETGLATLRDLATAGVQDDTLGQLRQRQHHRLPSRAPLGDLTLRPVQSMEEAMTFLRVNLAIEASRARRRSRLRFFRTGLTANLAFDRERTRDRETETRRQSNPCSSASPAARPSSEPGQRVVTRAVRDAAWPTRALPARAHRRAVRRGPHALRRRSSSCSRWSSRASSTSGSRIPRPSSATAGSPPSPSSSSSTSRRRLVYSIGGLDFFIHDGSWPPPCRMWRRPALAPSSSAILIDAGSASSMALLISIFTASSTQPPRPGRLTFPRVTGRHLRLPRGAHARARVSAAVAGGIPWRCSPCRSASRPGARGVKLQRRNNVVVSRRVSSRSGACPCLKSVPHGTPDQATPVSQRWRRRPVIWRRGSPRALSATRAESAGETAPG